MASKKEKVVTLDLTGCKNWIELHERIHKEIIVWMSTSALASI